MTSHGNCYALYVTVIRCVHGSKEEQAGVWEKEWQLATNASLVWFPTKFLFEH